MHKCPICSTAMKYVFSAKLLNKYDVGYYYCAECGFLKTEKPYWLDEAYADAIASTDTGLVLRNNSIGHKLASILFFLLGERGKGKYADMAGGYGMLTRLMRDRGFDFYWSDKYCKNLMARGFDYDSTLGSCVAITAIEIMEHLEDPLEFIRDAIKNTKAEAFIFTTELFAGDVPLPSNWWYYSFETGQHIAFFQKRTLEVMAKKLELYFVSGGGVHVFSRRPINLNLFRLFASRLSIVFSWWSRKILESRVMSDHHKMVDVIRNLK